MSFVEKLLSSCVDCSKLLIMLPRLYRLPATVRLKNPTTYVTPFYVIKIAPNDQDVSRFGFIIGKAVAKEAVHRNRARRLLRSCIEERLMEIKSGYDMLFLLKKGIIGAERENLAQSINEFLSKKHFLQ